LYKYLLRSFLLHNNYLIDPFGYYMSPQCPDIFYNINFLITLSWINLVIYHLYANVKQWWLLWLSEFLPMTLFFVYRYLYLILYFICILNFCKFDALVIIYEAMMLILPYQPTTTPRYLQKVKTKCIMCVVPVSSGLCWVVFLT
jgi:hypothetical protein